LRDRDDNIQFMERKTKVLIIDDDDYIVKALGDHLSRKGYEIHVATDGEEGLEAVRRKEPDLVLLDIVMPRKDGIALLKNLKENEDTQQIPVIMITNLESKDTLEEMNRLGISAIMVKANYGLVEVIDMIEQTLRAK
jgi:DNA-binding response OmpR family regulator